METLVEEVSVLFPPEPPSTANEIIIPGRFEYVTNKSTREMLINAWQAVTLTETWRYLKRDVANLSSENAQKIIGKMYELEYSVGHSGSSFWWCIKILQFIEEHGEEAFKKKYEAN
jgi:glucan-binding YG repeat protein